MHRTQIYLQEAIYQQLKHRAQIMGLSVSELVRRAVEKEFSNGRSKGARAFFDNLKPLASFADVEPEAFLREIRGKSRILHEADND